MELNNVAEAVSYKTFSPLQMMKSKERICLSLKTQGHLYKSTEEHGQTIVCLYLTLNISAVISSQFSLCCSAGVGS